MSDTREQLSPLSVSLHWLIGLTMIAMVFLGLWMADLPKDYPKADKLFWINLHKSIGILVLVVGGWRLVRRLMIGLPQNVGVYQAWEQLLAKSVHYLLLLATIALPISGILFSIGFGRSIEVFGVTVIPKIFETKQEPLASLARG